MKMTKLLLAAAAATFMMAGQANAVTQNISSGASISNVSDCTLLSASVTVSLSNNVKGGYNCDDTANQMLYFGTCSVAGSTADRSYTCTAADVSGSTNGCATAGEVVAVSGRAAFLGSSDGGVIAGLNLNATGCDDTNIASRIDTFKSDYETANNL